MPLISAGECREHGASSAKLTRVFFDGVERTKNSVLIEETRFLFKAKTFNDLVLAAYQAKQYMEQDGLFDYVGVLIDVDKSPTPVKNGYEITFVGQEPALGKGKIGMNVSNRGEGSVVMTGQGRNIFGAGEAATAEVSKGSEKTTSFSASFQKPLIKFGHARLGLNVYRSFADHPWSGFCQVENGLGLDLTHFPSKNVMHQLRYLASWRRVDMKSDNTAFHIREHAGHSLKSSIQNILAYDSRDDVILASKGALARCTYELAGLGGDVKFLRQDFEASLARTLPLVDAILAVNGQLTYVKPMAGSTLNVCDRTFLGGATTLRGFCYNGVGPVSDNCFTGGMATWCAAGHLYKRLWPNFFFAHLFVGIGNIFPVSPMTEKAANWRQIANGLSTAPRLSVGAGVAVKISQIARLEFNYCLPYSYHDTDKMQRGFQFGVGLNFV